ncbi:MAG: diaminopimelate decarboxylase [Rhodocyclaceae bacterium]|nr:diaminopimelate decarboxylase [Rhodocyclaceae bacterium]
MRLENVPLTDIAARFGTPCYVYSSATLTAAFESYREALSGREHLICYAVKANPNLAILSLFARLGAGFDIVSGGELARVIKAGGDPGKVIFSGVGKTSEEMALALTSGIRCFNIESASELTRLNGVAATRGVRAPIAFRVNPDVDAKTHPYISTGLATSKFGIPFEAALPLYRQASTLANIEIIGIDCHIGSQLLDPAPAAEAASRVKWLVETLEKEGITLSHIDVGGGLGIRYRDESVPSVADYLAPILSELADRPERLIVEPGRSLVGDAGGLLTRVITLKHSPAKNFAVVDAAMNDLARPALYDAWHDILPVMPRAAEVPVHSYDIVGPICESGDFLGHDRALALMEGDLLLIRSAGAYGMSMSSNYNSRPRAAEVMVDADSVRLIRAREPVESLYALEFP